MSKPTKTWKIGLVECAEFENKIDGKDYTAKSYIFKRSYKDGEEWKSTQYYNFNDLQKISSIITDIQKQAMKVINNK